MTDEEKIKNGVCPDCEHPLTRDGGCQYCTACGWGACNV